MPLQPLEAVMVTALICLAAVLAVGWSAFETTNVLSQLR
jgi:hypothetical protein